MNKRTRLRLRMVSSFRDSPVESAAAEQITAAAAAAQPKQATQTEPLKVETVRPHPLRAHRSLEPEAAEAVIKAAELLAELAAEVPEQDSAAPHQPQERPILAAAEAAAISEPISRRAEAA